MSSAIEILKEMFNSKVEYWGIGQFEEKKEAIKEALLALQQKENDCINFGYWLVNAPSKEIHKKSWIERKYQQYLKEKQEKVLGGKTQ